MRPLVANVTQFAYKATLREPERSLEDIVPGFPCELQQTRRVPLLDWFVAQHWIFGEPTYRIHTHSSCFYGRLHFTVNERRETRAEQLHPFANTFLIGDCHTYSSVSQNSVPCSVSATPRSRAIRMISGQLWTRLLYERASAARFLRSHRV